MQETALFFEHASGQKLFGYLHHGKEGSSLGVVFCHPFGEEKHRSYRAFVEFSRYLGKQGISSFRFDMRGAGDSDCDVSETDINSQIDDTKAAISEFIKLTQVERVILVGLRMGAAIASLTAEQDPRIAGLLLLGPVIKGNGYWRELLRTKQFASISLGQQAPKTSELMNQLEVSGHLEIEAQLLSKSYVEGIQAIDLLKTELNFSGDVLITCLGKDSLARQFAGELQEKYAQNAKSSKLWAEEEKDYWTIQSLYDQYLPQATYEITGQWIAQLGQPN